MNAHVLRASKTFSPRGRSVLGLPDDVEESYALLEDRGSAQSTASGAAEQWNEREEEIYWSNKQLVWTSARGVSTRFSFEGKILDVCWSRFRPLPGVQDSRGKRREWWLCTLCADGTLYAYSEGGEELEVVVPMNSLRVWTMPFGGLLLQRKDAPFLEYLPHPLDELESVQVGVLDMHDGQTGASRAASIVWCDATFPLMVSFDQGQKQHHLWQITYTMPDILHPGKVHGPTLHLQPIWSSPTRSDAFPAVDVFLCENLEKETILCLMLEERETLYMLHVGNSEINPQNWHVLSTGQMRAKSATSLYSSRQQPLRDLLVIDQLGNLCLYIGDRLLCTCRLNGNIPGENCREANNRHLQEMKDSSGNSEEGVLGESRQYNVTQDDCLTKVELLRIEDGVGYKATLVDKGGTRYRCEFTRFAANSPLCSMSLEMLFAVLTRDKYFDFWKNFVGRIAHSTHKHWEIFCALVVHWLQGTETPPKGNHAAKPVGSPWDRLLASDFHRAHVGLYKHILPLPPPKTQEDYLPSQGMIRFASEGRSILEGLHALYEDCKMDMLQWDLCKPIAKFCQRLALLLAEAEYVEYYARELDDCTLPRCRRLRDRNYLFPADLHKALMLMFCRGGEDAAIKHIPPLLQATPPACIHWSRDILFFFDILHREGAGGHERLLVEMINRKWGLAELERLPPGIAIPLHEAVRYCRASPPSDRPAAAYALACREDLAAMASLASGEWNSFEAILHALPSSLSFLSANSQEHCAKVLKDFSLGSESQKVQTHADKKQHDNGTEDLLQGVFLRRFPNDIRLMEVCKLLTSADPRPITLKENHLSASGDPEIVAAQQTKLWTMASRTTSLPIGRGALTLATCRNRHFDLGGTLPVPELCLSGTLPHQRGAIVALDFSSMGGSTSELVQQYLAWPEFHNGVAAGLRLCSHSGRLTRSWIEYNRPKTETSSHAGLMLALGLQGHLRSLTTSDIFLYLSMEHELTTIGMLVGLGAAHRGTMDEHISKVLFLHVPSQHPTGYPELELSSHVQAAAILSAGLLYEGSCQRLVSGIFLEEIGRKASESSEPMRPAVSGGSQESYALAAGFALGLVLLGKGRAAHNVADLHIEDRLLHFINGGADIPAWLNDGSEQGSRAGQKAFKEVLPDESKAASTAGSATGATAVQANGLVMDGGLVNTHVTAPASMMALALIFLKTNDKAMAAQFQVPSTLFSMDYVRPDFVLLRVLTRSLIMWDGVHPAMSWVDAQMPPLLEHVLDDEIKLPEGIEHHTVDVEQLALMHINIRAGAALSIGIRFAGTSDKSAYSVLNELVIQMSQLRKSAAAVAPLPGSVNLSSPPGERLDKASIEACLDACALGLALVMAGTGDLSTLQILRQLYRRLEAGASNLVYGSHMALSMAIGFLFMGGGTHTFGTSNQAIAALLISLFPVFPQDTTDNRCHLQALRHLYVLAAEQRCVEAVDVDTQQPVFVPVEIGYKCWDGNVACRKEVAPFLLPEHNTISYVKVCGPRYWEQALVAGASPSVPGTLLGALYRHGKVFVKRRVEVLPYSVDPEGSGSKLSTMLEKSNSEDTLELVRLFATDPSVCTFAEELCKGDGVVPQFHRRVLHECICEEKLSALSLYVFFFSMFRPDGGLAYSYRHMQVPAATLLWSLRFALAYYDRRHGHGPQLVHSSFLRSLWQHVEGTFLHRGFETPGVGALARYIDGEALSDMPLFGAYLQVCEIPNASQVHMCPRGAPLLSLAAHLPHVDGEALVRLARATSGVG